MGGDITITGTRYSVNPLYQWDINQVLQIYGLSLSKIPEIHFTNNSMERAIVRQSTMDDAGVITVEVPNSLLQKPYPITAYVCIRDGDTFVTLYKIDIPVKARKEPSDYVFIDNGEDIYSFNQMENMVNNVVFNLRADNEKLHSEILDDVGKLCTDTINELKRILDNTSIGNADRLDGHDSSDFVLKSTSATHTLLASNWTTGKKPYTNTISVKDVTENCNVEVVIPPNATLEQIRMFQLSQILNGTQTNGKITLQAWERVPTIDLPIMVIVRRD